jgi:hypothetical protein
MPLLDIHDNVNYHVIVYGGSSNNGALEMAYQVSAVRNSATQYTLTVTLLGATSLTRIQFFLLLIGNEAATHLEAHTIGFYFVIQAELLALFHLLLELLTK